MSSKHTKLLAVVVFAAIFAMNIKPLELGDFWWHLATGKWIVQNGQIPESDPFSYTVGIPQGIKMAVLKSYWLAQVLFYTVFKAAGLKGIIFFRAALFTMMYFAAYHVIRNKGLSRPASLVLILPIIPAASTFMHMRPKVFSYLAVIFAYMILDRLREDKEAYRNKWLLMALPLLMLAWSNMHGGYIVGAGMIGIFLVVETVEAIKRGVGSRFKTLAVISTSSILLCGLNPMGFTFLDTNIIMGLLNKGSVKGMESLDTVIEFLSLYDHYRLTGDKTNLITITCLSTVMLISFALNYKKTDPFRLALGAVFMGASFLSLRYGIYLLFIAVVLTGTNLAQCSIWLSKWARKSTPAADAIAQLAAAAAVLLVMWPNIWATISSPVPDKAARFIKENRVDKELLASYIYGGYLIWALGPEYKTFMDGRILDDKVYELQEQIMRGTPRMNEIFRGYNINSILLYTVSPYDKIITPLMFHLLKSSEWNAVFFDRKSVVFNKRGSGPPPIDKNIVWDALLDFGRGAYTAGGYYFIGEIYFHRGMIKEATESFLNVQRLQPGEPRSLTYLSALGYR